MEASECHIKISRDYDKLSRNYLKELRNYGKLSLSLTRNYLVKFYEKTNRGKLCGDTYHKTTRLWYFREYEKHSCKWRKILRSRKFLGILIAYFREIISVISVHGAGNKGKRRSDSVLWQDLYSGGFRGGGPGGPGPPPFLTQVYNVYHFEGQMWLNIC